MAMTTQLKPKYYTNYMASLTCVMYVIAFVFVAAVLAGGLNIVASTCAYIAYTATHTTKYI